jgi:RimJ/RimL family protein N-acetyltransferase
MQGKLVRLRGCEKSDVDLLLKWSVDGEVIRWHGPPAFPVTRAQLERDIERLAEASDARHFAIETLSGELIGDGGLRAINWVSRKAEFYITIGDRHYWDRGYGTDALLTFCRFGFDKLNLNRIWLTVLIDNQRAVRCYEKCGFAREGLLRQESYVDGQYRDVYLMALLRGNFQAAKQAAET